MKLKDYIENFEKKLNEVSVTGGASSFVGQAGDIIDQKFAGPYHPIFGDLEKLLNQQVDGDIAKRIYTDNITPRPDEDFIDLEWDYEYDEEIKKDNSKFKTNSETEMQIVDMEIPYDEIIDKTEENEKFINDTNDWKSIYDSKKY